MANRHQQTAQDDIPTLTDIVKRGSDKTVAAKQTVVEPPTPDLQPIAVSELTSIDREQLEKLIYSTLEQNLATISRQLADILISELNTDTQTSPYNNTKKPKPRR